MEDSRINFIKERIAAGTSVEEIRRELILHGHSVDGFEVLHQKIVQGELSPAVSEQPAVASFSPVTSPVAPVQPAGQGVPAGTVALPTVTQFIKLTFRRFFDRSDVLWPAIGLLFAGLIPLFLGFVAIGFMVAAQGELDIRALFYNKGLVGMVVAVAVVGFIFSLVVGVLNNGALAYVYGRFGETHSYKDGLKWAWRHFWSIVLIGFLTTMIAFTGAVFFIIPGLVFIAYALFSMLTLVTEDRRGFSAVLRSVDLVSGAFWGIAGRLVVLWIVLSVLGGIVNTLVQLITGVASQEGWALGMAVVVMQVVNMVVQSLTGWLSLVGIATLLEYRRAAKPVFNESAYSGWKVTYIIAFVIGLIGFLAVFGLMAFGASYYYLNSSYGLEDDWYITE